MTEYNDSHGSAAINSILFNKDRITIVYEPVGSVTPTQSLSIEEFIALGPGAFHAFQDYMETHDIDEESIDALTDMLLQWKPPSSLGVKAARPLSLVSDDDDGED